ncbi:MAG TPA: glycosyltransferase family 1 protein [Acidimicrobiia bacterium]|nr:glycosyltransferase family 1 protein [Acidimicrobiia bacterium]
MIKVSFDMTPAIGNRTGIGNVVAHLFDSISASDQIELAPYTLSYKARSFQNDLPDNNIFINYPASIMSLIWKYSSLGSLDKKIGNFDLWHATNYLAPPTKKPTLITIHDVTMFKYPELVPAKTRSIVPIIQKRLIDGAHVHVPAKAIKLDVLEHFENYISDSERVHVVPFSVPELFSKHPSDYAKKLSAGDPYILSIGTLEPRKNHARLIEAFGLVHTSNPNLRLFLVGADGPARPQVDKAMAQVGAQARSKIVITGPVSQADRTYLLQNSYLVAYPSLYEGFGLPLLEAMATSSPIVTTKEGSLPEVGGNAAHYVDAHSSADIARGILEVVESEDLRVQLVEAGKHRAKQFSWSASAEMLVKVYKDVISDKG